MTPDRLDRLEMAARRFARTIGTAEGWLTVLFGCVILLMLDGVITVVATYGLHGTPAQRAWSTAGFLLIVMFDLPYGYRLISAVVRHDHPLGLTVASRQWVPPVLLRPIVVVWWLGHFLAAVPVAFILAVPADGVGPVLPLLMATGAGFAANGFLIAAVSAATQSDRTRRLAWHGRILIDVSLGVLTVTAAAHHHRPQPAVLADSATFSR